MLINIRKNKSIISTWLLVFFILTIIVGASISDFFQAPTRKTHSLDRYKLLLHEKDLADVSKITFSNRLGSFQLEKMDQVWELISPRKLRANEETIGVILHTLKRISIRKIFPKDPINMSNFSLKNPLIKIDLRSTKLATPKTIQLGLINPIDNSTYLLLSDTNDVIYHVDTLKSPIETLDLADFIDSNVFFAKAHNISSLKIYRRSKKHGSLQLSISKNSERWLGKNSRVLNSEKIAQYLEKLTSIKSYLILDEINEKLDKRIQRYLSSPIYEIEIMTTNSDQPVSYKISNIVSKLPGIKIEKKEHFLVQASNRKHPYLVNKDSLSIFNKRQSSFAKMAIKKIFY